MHPKEVKRDLELISDPRFVLDYVKGGDTYYPIDMFDSLREANAYHNGKSVPHFMLRAARLGKFVYEHLLTTISRKPAVVIHSIDELSDALMRVVPGPKHATVLFSDSNSARSGVVEKAECRLTWGTVESVWGEGGKGKGFNVWFNGELRQCPYSFVGNEHSLLHNKTLAFKKKISFYLFAHNGIEQLIGKCIEWDEKPWRAMRLRGKKAFVEKCALCGDTRWVHANRGLCKSCECNLPLWFSRYGPDKWLHNIARMDEKRQASCWSPTLLALVDARFRGHKLVARDDGAWMFKPDEQALELYAQWLAKSSTNKEI
jgi:hypothetical protein